MALTIETNEQYEAAALRLGELSHASVESLDDAEFEAISAAMMSFEARRLSMPGGEAIPLAAPAGSAPV